MQLQLLNVPPRPRVPIGQALIHILAERAEALTGLEPGSLYRQRRARDTSWVRFAVMKVAVEAGRSTSVIGRVLRMDHTSVIHGVRRASQIEQESAEFAELLKLLRRETAQ